MKFKGLSKKEVEKRINDGKVNYVKDKSDKSILQIILSNIFTYFNGIFCLLSILLMVVGSYKNLTFLPVVIANILIGIVQQLRAKKVLDSLALLDICEYNTIRDGKEEKVLSTDLVLDDIVILSSGQQIPADAVVMDGDAYVNESLLTGEADEIHKVKNSELKSGSFLVAGSLTIKLTMVGEDSYINQLSLKAKEVKNRKSEMINDIEKIIKIAGTIIIPIGLALVFQALFLNGSTMKESITPMVGAVVGMIPEGMYLLVTVALALSAMRLAKKKVLFHDMRSIETLARIDVLCVDKTGTITSDKMSVIDVFGSVNEKDNELNDAKEVFSKYVNTIGDNNITMEALRKYFISNDKLEVVDIISFSSKKKCSVIKTKEATYKLGAPEFILDKNELNKNQKLINKYASQGKRVLVFTKDNKPILFITLINEVRDSAIMIFKYFYEQGIDIKVISGDNPLTVSKVAKDAKIKNYDKYIDATELDSYEKILDAVKKYTVFGRVQPEQKQMIVKALKENGLKTAMTGDGVNDILAMKKADCSIAMGEGSDAARQAAQVVLLDSDFSHMKDIVHEGRRDINNITRSASLFLYKNIFSVLLALFSIITITKYPLQPTQISMISLFNIGIPAFLLALENNEKKQKGKFIVKVFASAIPAAFTSFIAILFFMYFANHFNIPSKEISTSCVYLLEAMGFNILWYITRPLNKYHIVVFIICILGIILSSIFLNGIFDINPISFTTILLTIGIGITAMVVVTIMTYLLNKIVKKKMLKNS